MDILICQMCGSKLRAESKFCSGCGAPVPKSSPTTPPVLTQIASDTRALETHALDAHALETHPLETHALEKVDSQQQITELLSQDNGTITPAEGLPGPNPLRYSSAEAPASLKQSINPIESDNVSAAKSAKPAKSAKSAKPAKKSAVNLVTDNQNKLTEPKQKKKGNDFLAKFGTIADITIKTILCLFLAGMLAAGLFIMFKKGMIKLPFLGGGSPQQQDKLPSLTGDWMIRYSDENSDKIEKYAVMAVQHAHSIIGKGSDAHGDYYISGLITPPATIELSKVTFVKDKPQQPFFFSGTFNLDSEPLSASGKWHSQHHLVGKNSKNKEERVSGSWNGTFFPNPDYNKEKIQPPAPLPPPTEPKPPSVKPTSSMPTPANSSHSAHHAKHGS